MPIKTLGSLGKIRVGQVPGNTHIFWPSVQVMNHCDSFLPDISAKAVVLNFRRRVYL